MTIVFLGFSSAHASEITGTLSSSGVSTSGSTSGGSISGVVDPGGTITGTVVGGTTSGGGGGSSGGGGGSSGGGGGSTISSGALTSASTLSPLLPNTGEGGDKITYALMVVAVLGFIFAPLGFLSTSKKN